MRAALAGVGWAVAAAGFALAGCRASREEPAGPPAGRAAAPRESVAVRAGPVSVVGRVVDAGTSAGIGNAIVIVLRPGVTSQEWVEAKGEAATEALMRATAVTDEEGAFEVPDLERGHSYTVMVTANGYAPAVFEGGLEITAADSAIMSLQDVRLEPR